MNKKAMLFAAATFAAGCASTHVIAQQSATEAVSCAGAAACATADTLRAAGRIYPIVSYGAPILRAKCQSIEADYPALETLIADMFLTLTDAEGVGLAAPQIGKSIRLFVVDCTPWGEDDPSLTEYKQAFINPEIYHYSESTKLYGEGCLSFGEIRVEVLRSLTIRMRYLDTDFVAHDEEFTGLKAWVIQHEYDHIEGRVFIDHLSLEHLHQIEPQLRDLAAKTECERR